MQNAKKKKKCGCTLPDRQHTILFCSLTSKQTLWGRGRGERGGGAGCGDGYSNGDDTQSDEESDGRLWLPRQKIDQIITDLIHALAVNDQTIWGKVDPHLVHNTHTETQPIGMYDGKSEAVTLPQLYLFIFRGHTQTLVQVSGAKFSSAKACLHFQTHTHKSII